MADSTYTTIADTTKADKAPDLFTHAYEVLRDSVLTGRFGPGVQLKERALAEELGISRTPLRQALVRLTSDGLLSQLPHVGVFVRKLDFKQTWELLGVRRILEAGTAACAAEAVSEEAARELLELGEKVDAAAVRPDMFELRYLELDFHRRVLGIANNSELQRIAENTKALYFTLGAVPKNPMESSRFSDRIIPHAAVARAIAGGRPEVAFKTMWDHFRVVCERLLERVGENEVAAQMQQNGLR